MSAYDVQPASPVDIRESREAWNALVMEMRRPSVFCTWEWIHTWHEFFGADYETEILFVRRDGILVAILPLAARTRVLENAPIPARVLSFAGSHELSSDHIDVIGSEDVAREAMDAAVAYLGRKYREWDVIQLSHTAADSALLAWARERGADAEPISVAPYISLDGSFADWSMSLRGHKRRELNRLKRKLPRDFGLTFASYNPVNLKDDVAELFRLHQMRSQAKGLKTSFQGETMRRVHQRLAALLAERGWLSLVFLRNGTGTVAANYGFTFGGRYFGYQMGIDPDWASKGAGAVLLYQLIESIFGQDFMEFDFLRGGEEYKDTWTSQNRILYRIMLYGRTVRGRTLQAAFGVRKAAKRLVGR